MERPAAGRFVSIVCYIQNGKQRFLRHKERNQNVYIFNVPTDRKLPLDAFHSPPEYTGEWRRDKHPHFSPDGRKVAIDSPHGGNDSQMYSRLRNSFPQSN